MLKMMRSTVVPLTWGIMILYFLQFFVFSTGWTWAAFTIDALLAVPLALLSNWSHYVAGHCDPGHLEKRHVEIYTDTYVASADEDVDTQTCKKCEAFKTAQVHHCRNCDKCVFLMDHHCMWTNNCIGYNSVKPFALFCFYTVVLSMFGVSMVVYRTLGLHYCESYSGIPFHLLSLVSNFDMREVRGGYFILLQMAAAAGVFAGNMLRVLLIGLKKNESMVDQVKKAYQSDAEKSANAELKSKPQRTWR